MANGETEANCIERFEKMIKRQSVEMEADSQRASQQDVTLTRESSGNYAALKQWAVANLAKRLLDNSLLNQGAKGPGLFSIGRTSDLLAGSTVWGAALRGTRAELAEFSQHSLQIQSVRGPWSRRVLEHIGVKVNPVYGDPMLLFASLFPEFKFSAPRKSSGTLLALEGEAQLTPAFLGAETDVDFLNPASLPNEQVENIVGADFIISTSVTIVAIAESFNVPARLIDPTVDREFYFQHRDYLSGTNRPFELTANNVPDALRLGGYPQPEVDFDALRESFPFDLWDGNQRRESHDQPLAQTYLFGLNSTQGWIESLLSDEIDIESSSKLYSSLLEKLVTGETSIDTVNEFEIFEHRYWGAPNLDLSGYGPQVQSLDYVVRNNWESLDRALQVQQRGLAARVYSVLAVDSGIILGMILSSPYLLDLPVSFDIRVTETGRIFSVEIPQKTIRIGQSLIDMDVHLEEISLVDIESMDINIRFASGFNQTIAVDAGQSPWIDSANAITK